MFPGSDDRELPPGQADNVVRLRTGDCGLAARPQSATTATAKDRAMVFLNGPRADVNGFRISALFESDPDLDEVVVTMIRNGFRYVADLNAARVADVFANSSARLDERRRVIERLRSDAQVRLVS